MHFENVKIYDFFSFAINSNVLKKIKVAFFADILERDFDGAARTIYKIIDSIAQDKFEYFFICGVPPKKKDNFKYRFINVPTCPIPLNNTYRLAIPFLRQLKIENALKNFHPDVIHITTPSLLGNFAMSWAKKNGVKTISIYHTHFISYIDYYFKWFPFLIPYLKRSAVKKMKNFYDRCDKIYVPTHGIIKELQQLGLKMNSIKLWQRGIDKNLFNPLKKNPEYIRSITGNNRPNILFVSRLVWEKNLEVLREVFLKIKASDLELNFIVAGDGVARQELETTMPGAIFLGNIDHQTLSVLYASSDVFIFPSVSESYGNVVVEAMASGLACVIANGGGSASLVNHGVNGFLCSPKDADEYIYYIKKLIKDEDIYRNITKNAIEYTKLLDWDILLRQYFDDIERLAQEEMQTSLEGNSLLILPYKKPC